MTVDLQSMKSVGTMANPTREKSRRARSYSASSTNFSTSLPPPKKPKRSWFRASVLGTSNSLHSEKPHNDLKMPKKNGDTPTLHLGDSNFNDEPPQRARSPLSPNSLSPLTPKSARSPSSPHFNGSTIRPITARSPQGSIRSASAPKSPALSQHTDDGAPPTPGITAIPPYPPSPRESTKQGGESHKSFFSSFKSSKSSHRTQPSDVSSSQLPSQKPVSRGSSKDRSVYKSSRGRNESSPDLPITSENDEAGAGTNKQAQSKLAGDGKPEESSQTPKLATKRSKPRFAHLLNRTRSIRVEDPVPPRPSTARRPSAGLLKLETVPNQDTSQELKTAPLENERAFKEALDPPRNRSAERAGAHEGPTQAKKERSYGGAMLNSAASSALFTNLKQTSTGAADRLGKAGKGFLGRITRSGSTGERDAGVGDDNYVCSVINLPLVEQVRRTRISKSLDACKDKTEFWMPALPWRCIDYLNFKGCEEEGLYRIPGSGKDVKHWQRRFDTELDISLFDEPDLYDINTIGSLFKGWLRELPEEIFPKETQNMIADKYPDATSAPQLLKDELSKLPPYNYYLLFAITCHLSLLHSYVDQNKMDYRNLCICVQPAMKLDGYCFHFLVCDWKNCWQGCWTEKEYLEAELDAGGVGERKKKQASGSNNSVERDSTTDEHAVSSSSSSRKTSQRSGSGGNDTGPSVPKKGRKTPPPNIPTTSSHTRSASQLPELGPPLSPIEI